MDEELLLNATINVLKYTTRSAMFFEDIGRQLVPKIWINVNPGKRCHGNIIIDKIIRI